VNAEDERKQPSPEQGEQEGTLDAAWAKHCLVSYGEVVPLGKTMFRAGWQAGQAAAVDSLALPRIIGGILDRIDMAPNDDPLPYVREYVDGLRARMAATVDSRDVEVHNAAIEMAANRVTNADTYDGRYLIAKGILALKRTAPKKD
jgi:hypothetical protein